MLYQRISYIIAPLIRSLVYRIIFGLFLFVLVGSLRTRDGFEMGLQLGGTGNDYRDRQYMVSVGGIGRILGQHSFITLGTLAFLLFALI